MLRSEAGRQRADGMPPWAAVFLDRDGTVNVKAPEGGYVAEPAEVVLLPRAAAAIARLNGAGIPAVLVTNQRWLADSGAAGPARYAATHARLVELLADQGARLDAAYHCPHAAASCRCRKPAPGMLLAAARDLGVDLRAAALVGDSATDVEAGRAAGAYTVLLGGSHPAADAVAPDLWAAVDLLLSPPRETERRRP